ncbi:MAG: hypothetical protein AAFQ75_11460, partial [Pseudomonadota bacterium]
MKRTLIGSTLAILLAGGAALAANTVTIHDQSRADFDVKRGIVETVERLYGRAVIFSDPNPLPAGVEEGLVEGERLPATAPIDPVPGKLMDALPVIDNARWVRIGDHIVAVDDLDIVRLA